MVEVQQAGIQGPGRGGGPAVVQEQRTGRGDDLGLGHGTPASSVPAAADGGARRRTACHGLIGTLTPYAPLRRRPAGSSYTANRNASESNIAASCKIAYGSDMDEL
nr:hypothetical protein StreXyl84_02980 [Streptomyces sp. Xyl84]